MARKLTSDEEEDFADAMLREQPAPKEPLGLWSELKHRRDAELAISPELRALIQSQWPDRVPQ